MTTPRVTELRRNGNPVTERPIVRRRPLASGPLGGASKTHPNTARSPTAAPYSPVDAYSHYERWSIGEVAGGDSELLDADADTDRLVRGHSTELLWKAHRHYLRDLQRTGRDILTQGVRL